MGLRDFLMGAQQFQEGTGVYANAAEEIRKKSALEELNAKSGGLLESIRTGDPSQKAQALSEYNALSANAGQPANQNLLQYVFDKDADNRFDQTRPRGVDELKRIRPDLAEEDAAGISMLGRKDQELALATRGAAVKEENIQRRSDRVLSFRGDVEGQKQAKQSFDVLNKSEDAFREQDYKIKEIAESLKRGTSIDDNIAFGYIARSVAQEKGPLSDQDIARIQGVTGVRGTVDEFKARFNGETYTKLSQEQKEAIKKIVQSNAVNFSAKKAEALAADLNGLYQVNPTLRDKNGKPRGLLKQRIDDYKKQGIPINFTPEANAFVVEKGAKTVSGDNTDLVSAAESIKDPALKTKYIQFLNSNPDRQFTQEEIKHLKQRMSEGR